MQQPYLQSKLSQRSELPSIHTGYNLEAARLSRSRCEKVVANKAYNGVNIAFVLHLMRYG